MVWVFIQTELDWDGKDFQWTFLWLLFFFFFFSLFLFLKQQEMGQRTILPGSRVPSMVLHCLQETLFLPAKFFSQWTLKAYSALNIHGSLWCDWVFRKIMRKCRARQSHNWKLSLKEKQKEKKATERYWNLSENRVLNLKSGE